jgi:predicted glycosyltransferase
MRLLIDLQHPAHLHFFRPLVTRLQKEGHQVRLTGRDKDILAKLAAEYGMDVEIFGRARKGVWNLGRELICRQWRLLGIVRGFRPDLIMAIAGTYVSLVGRLLGVPTYVFYDTEHATLSNLLSYPFASCVYVPRCYRKPIRWQHRRYNGYHELAYLHPNYFTPDKTVLDEVGVREGEVFSIVRFVSWEAAHDIGLSGLSPEAKKRAVEELSRFGKVFISAEGPLPAALEEYRFPLKVGRLHHLMAFASLIFGESATMASEGAVLGVPAIYVDPVGRGYTDEQEREYGLVFNFSPERQDAAIAKAKEILAGYPSAKWHSSGKRLLQDKIDINTMLASIALPGAGSVSKRWSSSKKGSGA